MTTEDKKLYMQEYYIKNKAKFQERARRPEQLAKARERYHKNKDNPEYKEAVKASQNAHYSRNAEYYCLQKFCYAILASNTHKANALNFIASTGLLDEFSAQLLAIKEMAEVYTILKTWQEALKEK